MLQTIHNYCTPGKDELDLRALSLIFRPAVINTQSGGSACSCDQVHVEVVTATLSCSTFLMAQNWNLETYCLAFALLVFKYFFNLKPYLNSSF